MPIAMFLFIAALILEFVPHIFTGQYTVALILFIVTLVPWALFAFAALLTALVALSTRRR